MNKVVLYGSCLAKAGRGSQGVTLGGTPRTPSASAGYEASGQPGQDEPALWVSSQPRPKWMYIRGLSGSPLASS